ncbi:MAG: hypothetical protein ABH805_01015 [Candidatus Nealsonbacteria bacterium]
MNKKGFKKITIVLNRFLIKPAEHAMVTFLFLSFIALITGGFLFYQYSFLAEKSEPEIIDKTTKFKEEFYLNILVEWQEREAMFKKVDEKKYLNPFAPGPRTLSLAEKKLSEERTQELLLNPQIQALLKATNLYEFYTKQGSIFLTVDERAEIWEELELGTKAGYIGTYSQNIRFLSELKKELTP